MFVYFFYFQDSKFISLYSSSSVWYKLLQAPPQSQLVLINNTKLSRIARKKKNQFRVPRKSWFLIPNVFSKATKKLPLRRPRKYQRRDAQKNVTSNIRDVTRLPGTEKYLYFLVGLLSMYVWMTVTVSWKAETPNLKPNQMVNVISSAKVIFGNVFPISSQLQSLWFAPSHGSTVSNMTHVTVWQQTLKQWVSLSCWKKGSKKYIIVEAISFRGELISREIETSIGLFPLITQGSNYLNNVEPSQKRTLQNCKKNFIPFYLSLNVCVTSGSSVAISLRKFQLATRKS